MKLQACLYLLGFTDDDKIDWHHTPPLGLRERDEATGAYRPDELDPHYLVPMRSDAHDVRTHGKKGEKSVTSAGSDIHAIHKARRLRKAQAEFVNSLLAKSGIPERAKRREDRKRKIPSRPFQKRRKPALAGGSV